MTIKYSPDGDTLWTQWYDNTFYNGADAVTTDRSDNIIIAGYIWTDSTNSDMHIVKYDSDANLLWTRTYGNGEEDVGESIYGVATDSKNDIIVTGKADYNLGDYLTLKYDSNGNLLWVRTYNGGWEDYAQDVIVDDSDNIIVTGYSDSNINWDWCTIKYSPDGDIIWIRRYDIAITDWAFGVTTDREGNVIVVGETHQLLPGTGGCSGMVVKYSSQGDTLWSKIFTDTLQYAEVARFVDVTTDVQGNIYLAGEYFRWIQGGQSWCDYYIAKCTSLGDTVWTKRCSYGGMNEPCGITLDEGGNIIVTGSTYPNPESCGETDYFTVKLQNAVSSIEAFPSVPDNFALYQNYPNPFNASTTLRYDIPEAALVKIAVYDLRARRVGVLVNEYKQPGAYEVVWNGASFSSGIYFVRMTAGNYTTTEKMLLIK
ncbi:MAG: T9SS type A sorting domain-containing protein [Thermoplasmata archaeon]|nr:MAG: T9SS type A sorting domain-containing protein [Thermoplasmata archaeon]